jgi:hypothetical protein
MSQKYHSEIEKRANIRNAKIKVQLKIKHEQYEKPVIMILQLLLSKDTMGMHKIQISTGYRHQ